MTDPVIVTRAAKGNALTWQEGDANFTNLRDAIVDAQLPDQSGNTGKFLSTDGTSTSWQTVSGGSGGSGTPTLATFYWIDDELIVDHFNPSLIPAIVDGEFILTYNG